MYQELTAENAVAVSFCISSLQYVHVYMYINVSVHSKLGGFIGLAANLHPPKFVKFYKYFENVIKMIDICAMIDLP